MRSIPILIFLSTFFVTHFMVAQDGIGVGEWRMHAPAIAFFKLEQNGNLLYAASKEQLIAYDTDDLALRKWSSLDGLSVGEYSALHTANRTVWIGYENGYINGITQNGDVILIDYLAKANGIASKKINALFSAKNILYAAGDFGLLTYDLNKKQVLDTYIDISVSGVSNPVYEGCISSDNDSLYVTTSLGLMGVSLQSILKDYTQWHVYGASEGLSSIPNKVSAFQQSIICSVNGIGLLVFNGTNWISHTSFGSSFKARELKANNNLLYVCDQAKVYQVSASQNFTSIQGTTISLPVSTALDNAQKLWVLDSLKGISQKPYNQAMLVDGPYSSTVRNMKYIDQQIMICHGGLSILNAPLLKSGNTSWFTKEQTWQVNQTGVSAGYTLADIMDFVSTNTNRKYYASYGQGLFEETSAGSTLYNLSNSGLLSLKISSLALSQKQDVLWLSCIVSSPSDPFLYAYTKSTGAWLKYRATQSQGYSPQKIIVDKSDNKWITLSSSSTSKGLVFFNDKTNTQIYFTTTSGGGSLPSLLVNDVAVDLDGAVWIGTDKGIGIYQNPSSIKLGNVPDCYKPIVDGLPLFFDVKVNAIVVDGANRKWIGTNLGLLLMSSDGLTTLAKYTIENSPLLSDNILSLTYNPVSGELFISTDKGIISFRTNATEATSSNQSIKIFPNPVLPSYSGQLAISGLVMNARVKITDTAGRLVYENNANGGTLDWNLKDYNGNRVKAGVYLVFSTTEDGKEPAVNKFTVIE
jgi:ligand-binding sensor domain-containing protein